LVGSDILQFDEYVNNSAAVSRSFPRVFVNACGAKSGGARQMLAMLVRHAPKGRYVVACPNPHEFEVDKANVEFVALETNGMASAVFTLFKAEAMARRMGCEVLISMMNFNSLWGSCQHITYFHQMLGLTQNDPKSRFQRLMLRYGKLRGERAVCQTPFVARLLREKVGLTDVNAYWPGFHVEANFTASKKHAVEISSAPNFLVPLSNHETYKNLQSILAEEEFFTRIGATVSITGGTETKSVGPFDFLGKRPRAELFERIASAEAILFPSMEETCALPVAEALSLGTPAFVLKRPYNEDAYGGLKASDGFHPYDTDIKPAIETWIAAGRPKCLPQTQLTSGDWSWLP
jgi:hypothetical protein